MIPSEHYSQNLAGLLVTCPPRWTTNVGEVDLEKQHSEKPYHVGGL